MLIEFFGINNVIYIHTYMNTYNIYIAPYHKISRRITNGIKLHLTLPSYITEKK